MRSCECMRSRLRVPALSHVVFMADSSEVSAIAGGVLSQA